MRSVIPWSYSSWDSYVNGCPRKFYEIKIAKNFDDPPNESTIWGNEVHAALEIRAKTNAPLPDNMQRFQKLADRVIYAPGETYAELEVAVTIDLQPTGFWDNDAYARGKLDLVKRNGTVALVNDWKTGKRKNNSLQLDLAAVLTFAKFPEVERITSLFTWFQEPTKPSSNKFTREQMPEIMAQFKQGVDDMQWSEQNNVWPEKPSGLCNGWCPVRTCKHWRPKRPNYGRR